MKELVCIVCPKGCRLQVETGSELTVRGNSCEKGADYARSELLAPQRTLTTTVRVRGGALCRCPVRTAQPIPKEKMFEAMAVLNAVTLDAPIARGAVLVADLLGTGADVIAARSIEKA